jgi:hypothetical protein
MQAKLDEEAGQLVQLRQNIEQEWVGRELAGEARHQARDVQRHIVDDARARLPPASSGVSQNLAAAAILLRAMPEPYTTEGRRIQGELKNLLEDVAVRRAESSASQKQGCLPEHRATTSRLMQEDRSPSPKPPDLQAFSRAIRRAPFPARFRAPTTITKYSGETRPELWLADYLLASQLGGTDDDNLIIRKLPLFLSDAARAWLEHLPPAQISN